MTAAGGADYRGLRAAIAVARRDLLEFVRDRRTLFITLLMPMAMYPVLALSSMLGVRTALSDLEARQAPRRLTLAVSGADAEPFAGRVREAFAAAAADPPAGWPAAVAVEMIPAAEASAWLDSGQADVWLHVGPGTVRDLDGAGTVRLDARISAVRPIEGRVRDHFLAVMRAVADEARSRRVAGAGLAPTTLTPLAVDFLDGGPTVHEPVRGIVPTAVGAVLVLLALLTATGAFYPAIDAIAGEKERGTIETLLIAPCRSRDVVFGKFLAVFTVTLATLAMNAISIALTASVVLRWLPAGDRLGVGPAAFAACAAVAFVGYVGLAAVAAALCLAVTAASKSVKEAQNTLTPVILLVSALAGSALVPGVGATSLAAVPFAGQVAVAKAVLDGGPSTVVPSEQARLAGVRLAISLAASGLVTWLLLRATTAAVTDEEILFRGPDAAATRRWRPTRRVLPTPAQGMVAAAVGFAGLWYSQGLAPADLVRALPVQLALATLLPLAVLAWWQRVDLRATFRIHWPAGTPGRGLVFLGAAAVCGGCLFLVGAAALLTARGTHLSPEARRLSERLVELVTTVPWWASWLLIAVLPAVCEELLFRGWMLTALAGRRPAPGRALAAVAIQAACFAAFHLLPERMPQTFALGLLLGWLTLRSASILPAMLAHLVHNTVPLALYALTVDAVPRVEPVAFGLPGAVVAGAVGCLAAGLGIAWIVTRGTRSATTG
jgi:ABC-type Na+ efflux pump permease subunit/membrane protease YdiL (CAAX protease family)